MFLFAGFGFKCLAVCYRRNGFYNLSKRSKCCSFMTSSRRLLQKNAAFMILLSFLLLYTFALLLFTFTFLLLHAIEEVSPGYLSEKPSVKSVKRMSLRQKSQTVLHNQLQETVSGLCLLRLPKVMLSRRPALLEEDKAFKEANGPTQRVGCRQRHSRLRNGLHSGLIANKRVGSP